MRCSQNTFGMKMRTSIIIVFVYMMTYVVGFPGTAYVLKKDKKNKVLRVKLETWKPKEQVYNPEKVDWVSVISGCKAACRYERRLCNFYVRAAAHDALAISEGYGGADGSLLLTEDEIRRSENNYDNFAYLLSKNALALAKKYDASVADILTVCGAVATEFLGGPKIIRYDSVDPFLVGRYDRTDPNPAKALAPANMNTTGFMNFAKSKNLTLEDMTALMGSHTLLDEKGCLRKDNTYCNPRESNCTDILMYSWTNIYYKETCTPKIRINNPPVLSTLPLETKEFFIRQNLCKFTSQELRQRELDVLVQELIIPDVGVGNPDLLVINPDTEYEDVSWYNAVTKIAKKWQYTVHDAWMGKACQRDIDNTSYNNMISIYMNKYKNNMDEWNIAYIRAYKKMMKIGAKWYKKGGLMISGLECNSGYISDIPNVNCMICNNKNYKNEYVNNCPKSCRCKTSFKESESFYY